MLCACTVSHSLCVCARARAPRHLFNLKHVERQLAGAWHRMQAARNAARCGPWRRSCARACTCARTHGPVRWGAPLCLVPRAARVRPLATRACPRRALSPQRPCSSLLPLQPLQAGPRRAQACLLSGAAPPVPHPGEVLGEGEEEEGAHTCAKGKEGRACWSLRGACVVPHRPLVRALATSLAGACLCTCIACACLCARTRTCRAMCMHRGVVRPAPLPPLHARVGNPALQHHRRAGAALGGHGGRGAAGGGCGPGVWCGGVHGMAWAAAAARRWRHGTPRAVLAARATHTARRTSRGAPVTVRSAACPVPLAPPPSAHWHTPGRACACARLHAQHA